MTSRTWPALGAVLLLTLTVVPAASAAYSLQQALPFVRLGPNQGLNLTVFAGAMEGSSGSVRGAYAFENATGFVITGITEIYVSGALHSMSTPQHGSYHVVLSSHSLVAFDPGTTTHSAVASPYAIGIPIDLQGTIGGLTIGPSLLTVSTAQSVNFSDVVHIPRPGPEVVPTNVQDAPGAKLLLLNEQSSLVVTDGDGVAATVRGGKPEALKGVAMAGELRILPFTTTAAVMPFAPGASGAFHPATSAALATAGRSLGVAQLQSVISDLQGMTGQSSSVSLAPIDQAMDQIGARPILFEVLDAGMVNLPASAGKPDLANMTMARGGSFALHSDGKTVAMTGSSQFIVQGGKVVGSHPLVVILRVWAMPWWSAVLWVIGIGLWIACLVTRAPKKHETWDQWRWAGRIATLVTFLLLAWLWDRHVHTVLGVSALSPGLGTKTRLVLALVEYLLLTAIMFFVTAPVRLLLRSSFRLARQGTFMGMASPIALLLTYPLGAGLLLDYLGFLLQTASRLAGA